MSTSADFAATDRFEVRRRVGSGGMGVVYEAYDRHRRRVVALKTLKRWDAEGLLRFKSEFRMLHDLEHPNLISLGELFEVDREWFFSMEFVDGVDFLTYVRRPNRPPSSPDLAKRRVPFMPTERQHEGAQAHLPAPSDLGFDECKLRESLEGLATGIAAIHAAGKVHRDIKPSNVLVTRSGRVVLLDFGLVTHAVTEKRSTGEIVAGTAAYMAPEQAASPSFGPAADWYSLGVVLYEALTGRLPHTGATSIEILLSKQRLTPPPPRQCNPEVPDDLDELCVELLATKPRDRPSAADICARLGVPTGSAPSRARAQTHPSFTESSVFVGREDELRVLAGKFAAIGENPAIAVVEGESGVGKSRLVGRFTQLLREDREDVIVLAGRCYERESVPYKAVDGLADALSRYLSRLPDGEAAALLPTEAGLLPRLFQVFQRVEAIAQAPRQRDRADPHEQRRRMFEALRELLVRLTMRRPVVLVIDDMQWTDPDSVGLLWTLLSHADAPRLLLVVTTRPIEQPEKAQALSRLFELGDATRIQLAELSPEHAMQLAKSLLPDASPELVSELARESGGHPLFAHELCRGTSGEPGARKASLDDTLWSRIETLTDDSKRVLEAVCMAGSPTNQEIVANAVGRGFDDFSTRVALLRVAHLVRTDGVRRTDTIVSYHDRIRELVVRKLDDDQCRHWHSRLAVALERAGAAKSDPHALVLHAEAAGDLERAAQFARAAAAHAVEASAFDKAAEFLSIVLSLAQFDDTDARRTAQLQLADALSNAGRGPEAAAVFEAAAVGADTATRMDCQRQAAQQWLVTGHITKGLDALSVSLSEIGDALPASPRRALASLLWSRLRLRFRGMSWTAREESQISPATLERLDVLKTVAHNLATVDNIRGADYNARFLRLALKTGDPSRIVFAMSTEAVFAASQGARSYGRAQRLVEEVRRIAELQPDSRLLAGWAHATEGWVSHLQGRFKRADAALRKSSALFRDIGGTTFEQNNSQLWRVYAIRQLGGVNELRSALPEYLRDAQQRGDRFMETTLRRSAGRILLLSADDPAGARDDLERATWEPPEGAFHLQHWFELEALSEIALYEDTADDHSELFETRFELLERSMLQRVQLVRVFVTWTKARLILASRALPMSATDRAWKLAAKLRRERIGFADVMAALVRAAVAVHDERKGPAQAVEHLRDAIAAATDNDMAFHRAAAQHRLGALVGGSEGKASSAEADEWMREQQIVEPERMINIATPGFATVRHP